VNVRALTDTDADTVAALVRAENAELGRPETRIDGEDVRTWWERVDLGKDSWLFEDDGAALAAGWFELYGDIGVFVGVVAGRAKGRGIGSAIADRGEAAAGERGAVKIHTWAPPEDQAAAALFLGRGYREVRRFFHMAIELDGPSPQPQLADGLVLEEVREEDARAFYDALTEAFRDHWEWHALPYDEWWEMRRGQQADADGPLWFLVRDGSELAAVVRNEARSSEGYVGTMGVRRPWRGRGLGKALLYRTFDEFWRRGLTRVTLGVDAESPTGATKLYESVGMTVESTMVTYERAVTP